MAKFTSNKTINSEWRWNRFFGPAGSSFTIADAMYDEFIVDWAKQIADGDIVITETPTTGNIQMASLTVGDIVLTGTATGNFPGTGGGTTVVGTSPISVSTNSNTATVSIDQTLITAGAATTAEGTRTYVKNATASAMTKGQAVYINGATGTNVTIELATATSELGSSKVLGLLAQDLAVNAFGWVVESGFLGTIDTSTATAGQSVWLGDTPGSRVYGSPPAEPSNGVYLGVVARANSVNGEILVKVQNGYEIDELHDVSAASPSDGHIIQYKTSSGLWTGTSVANAGIAASSHTHAYQPAGTYVTAVSGTAPIAASTTTAGVVSVSLSASYSSSTHDHAGTYQPAGTYLTSISGTTPIVTTTSSLGVVAASHDTTDGYRHVPATSTTNSGKFLKAGATAGSEAWANIAMSDVTTGNYVATVAGGTGVTVTGADANGATKTVAIGQAVATSSTPTFAGLTVNGLITGSVDSGTTNVINGIILVRSTTASIATTTIPTSPTTANTTALSWSSALKANTAWWTTGSSITLPLAGMYSVTIALTAGSGTGYATAAYLFQGTTLRYHTEIQASANGQYDILNIAGMIYTTTANETIKVGIAASTTGKIINVTPKNGIMAVAYLGSF